MIHLAGANIIDARIHATRSGWAVDNFLSQDPHGRPFRPPKGLTRAGAERASVWCWGAWRLAELLATSGRERDRAREARRPDRTLSAGSSTGGSGGASEPE